MSEYGLRETFQANFPSAKTIGLSINQDKTSIQLVLGNDTHAVFLQFIRLKCGDFEYPELF